MVKYNIQVLEDADENCVHLLHPANGQPQSPVCGFIQCQEGIKPLEQGPQHLRGDLRHRYTGTFYGDTDNYVRNMHLTAKKTTNTKKMLKRGGVFNLKKGLGAMIAITSIGFGLQNLANIWDTCVMDGVISADDAVNIGLGMASVAAPLPVRMAARVASDVNMSDTPDHTDANPSLDFEMSSASGTTYGGEGTEFYSSDRAVAETDPYFFETSMEEVAQESVSEEVTSGIVGFFLDVFSNF